MSSDPEPPSSSGWHFATTRWTLLLGAAEEGHAAGEAYDWLCGTYWKPVFAFIRRHGNSPEDAADLTQGFFATFIARDGLSGLHREGARFATYLLVSVKNYLAQQHARACAARRGGGIPPVRLDADQAAPSSGLFAFAGEAPDLAFDRAWASAVMERAQARVAAECRAAGKDLLHDALVPFLARDPEAGEYRRIAADLGMKPGTIAVAVHRLRARLREAIAFELRQGGDLGEELAHLRACLAAGVDSV